MNKDLEKQIEEAAFDLFLNESGDMSKYRGRDLAIKLAKSEEAKEYWQQGMYSEEELLEFSWWLLKNVGRTSNDKIAHFEDKYYLKSWFKENKKK